MNYERTESTDGRQLVGQFESDMNTVNLITPHPISYSEETIRPCNCDLVTLPPETLVFKQTSGKVEEILVNNQSNRSVMWALKSNALSRLVARPSCGVLPSKGCVRLKIGLRNTDIFTQSIEGDRIAIDYNFIDNPNAHFDRTFLTTFDSNRRRKLLQIAYEL
ncbi:hypothetical protein AB6A40_008611 [Gnathostoma spinigerum]|uniref:Major sperm protein n=1 Tax=Gnathostoma spinigerum TaxID=75299 RepID=A0ABD6EYX0_9BILA